MEGNKSTKQKWNPKTTILKHTKNHAYATIQHNKLEQDIIQIQNTIKQYDIYHTHTDAQTHTNDGDMQNQTNNHNALEK